MLILTAAEFGNSAEQEGLFLSKEGEWIVLSLK